MLENNFFIVGLNDLARSTVSVGQYQLIGKKYCAVAHKNNRYGLQGKRPHQYDSIKKKIIPRIIRLEWLHFNLLTFDFTTE